MAVEFRTDQSACQPRGMGHDSLLSMHEGEGKVAPAAVAYAATTSPRMSRGNHAEKKNFHEQDRLAKGNRKTQANNLSAKLSSTCVGWSWQSTRIFAYVFVYVMSAVFARGCVSSCEKTRELFNV